MRLRWQVGAVVVAAFVVGSGATSAAAAPLAKPGPGGFTCIDRPTDAVALPMPSPAAGTPALVVDAAFDSYLRAHRPCPDGQVPEPNGSAGTPPSIFQFGAWYSYAGKSESPTDGTGAYGGYTLHTPTVANGDSHSLVEVLVGSGVGSNFDSLEAGWTVAPSQYPLAPTSTHFFIFKGVHNYSNPPGYVSCYDGCAGSAWHQVSSYAFPGAVIPGDGSKVPIGIYHDEPTGRWDFYLNGVDIGYYYDTSWPEYFHRNTLSQWYGEVSAAGSVTCSDMGAGVLPTTSSGAFVDYPTSTFGPSGAHGTFTNILSDPSWFSLTTVSGTTHAFRYGGPGAC